MGRSKKIFSQMPRINALREKLERNADYYFNINLYVDPDTKNPKPDPIDCYAISPEMKKIWDEIDQLEDVDLKDMLRIRFCQLVEFDFTKVADYYVKSDDKLKDLFERLALVVIDYESAIENGFFDVLKSINEFGEVKCNNTVYSERNKIEGKNPNSQIAKTIAEKKDKPTKKKPVNKEEPEVQNMDELLNTESPKKIDYNLDI